MASSHDGLPRIGLSKPAAARSRNAKRLRVCRRCRCALSTRPGRGSRYRRRTDRSVLRRSPLRSHRPGRPLLVLRSARTRRDSAGMTASARCVVPVCEDAPTLYRYGAQYQAMARSHVRKKRRSSPPAAAAISHGNQILTALPSVERQRLTALCEPIELTFGEVLCEQGARIRHVYFPGGGFISLISALDDRPNLEVGLVGAEGMLGVSLLLGVHVAPLRALVQGAGSALRMEAD